MKPMVWPPQPYAEELKRIRAIRAVKWAKVDSTYLYVCTRPRMLRNFTATKHKYLSQIVIRMSLHSTNRRPEFKYLHTSAEFFNPHPVDAMHKRIGGLVLGWRTSCLGGWDIDYLGARQRSGLVGGIVVMIQMLQAIY